MPIKTYSNMAMNTTKTWLSEIASFYFRFANMFVKVETWPCPWMKDAIFVDMFWNMIIVEEFL
jgi:hypothetical protein